MNFFDELQSQGYSDLQIRQVRYALKTIFNEVSKFVIIGIPFLITSRYRYYLVAMLLLLVLRRLGGGIHFKTYWGCLIFSALFVILGAWILPGIPITGTVQYLILIISCIIALLLAPVPSIYHAPLKRQQIIRFKVILTIVHIATIVLLIKWPDNTYLITMFWIIVIFTIQLVISFFQRRFSKHEEQTC